MAALALPLCRCHHRSLFRLRAVNGQPAHQLRARSSWLGMTKKSAPSIPAALVLAEDAQEKNQTPARVDDPFAWMLRDENISTVCEYIDKEKKFASTKRIDVLAREFVYNRHLESPFFDGKPVYVDYQHPILWELGEYYYFFQERGQLFERAIIRDHVTGLIQHTRFPLFHIDDLAEFLELPVLSELRIKQSLLFSPCGKFALVSGRFSHGLSGVAAVLSLADGLRRAERVISVVTGVVDAVWCGSSHLLCTVPGRYGRCKGEVRCVDLWSVPDDRSKFQPLHDALSARLVYREPNPRYSVRLKACRSGRYVSVHSQSQRSTEVHVVDCTLAEPTASSCVWPRGAGLECRHVDHYQGTFYALANTEASGEDKILCLSENDALVRKGSSAMGNSTHSTGASSASANTTNSSGIAEDRTGTTVAHSKWSVFVDSSEAEECFIKDMDFHSDYCVLTMRARNAQPYLHIVPLGHDLPGCLDHPMEQRIYPEFACTSMQLACNPSAQSVRIGYVQSGPSMPTVLSYLIPSTGQKLCRTSVYAYEIYHEQPVKKMSVVRRLSAVSPDDGADIPITLVHVDGCMFYRLLVIVYGDQDEPIDMNYCPQWFRLLMEGWTLAFCHVRGSRDLGRRWHLAGAGADKGQAFSDLKACVDHLHMAEFSRPEHTALYGFSAGATLVAGLAQREPELFRAAILHSPFVDVLQTYLENDQSQFGPERKLQDCDDGPVDEDAVRKIAEYCPYSNLSEQSYPDMLITTSRHNPVVSVVGIARYVAKLRSLQEPWLFDKDKQQHSALWFNVAESDQHKSQQTDTTHVMADKSQLAAEMIFLDRAV
eukprot:scpid47163/ scgid18633/ Prolyl endopeptidase-like; Prolylendopeptidase-like